MCYTTCVRRIIAQFCPRYSLPTINIVVAPQSTKSIACTCTLAGGNDLNCPTRSMMAGVAGVGVLQ
jgi:hypothetical protein